MNTDNLHSGRCFKTGAIVSLPEWQETVRADLYYVGKTSGCIVIKYTPESRVYDFHKEAGTRQEDFIVIVGSKGMRSESVGLIVVPSEYVTDVRPEKHGSNLTVQPNRQPASGAEGIT